MPRVLFVSYASPLYPQSGYSYRAHGVLRWLADRCRVAVVFEGHQEDLATSRIALDRFDSVEVIRPDRRPLRIAAAVAGPLPYHHRLYSSPEARRTLQRKLRSEHFDLVWLNKTVHFPVIEGLRGLPPVVVDQHALESVVWKNLIENDPRWWAKPFFRLNRQRVLRYDRGAYDRTAGVVCITPDEHRLMRIEYPGVASICVPQGVDPAYYRPAPGVAPDSDVLLFSGTGARRNVEAMKMFLRDILPRVQRRLPRARVLWIGNVSVADHPFLRRSDVTTTGFVPDTPPFFDRGRIFISPFTMGEGMKTKVVEALAMGKVVVGTSIGLAGIDPSGLPFVRCCDDPDEFASAIAAYREHPRLERLCEEARAWTISKFSWDAALEPLGPFLERVVPSFASTPLPPGSFPVR